MLTVHDHLHILDETVDNFEGLSCCNPGLVMRESVESLQDGLDVLLSLLHKLDWIALSKATPQREPTHTNDHA